MPNRFQLFVIFTPLLAVLASASGCGQQKIAAVPQVRDEKKIETQPHQEQPMHTHQSGHDHHDHVFTNPDQQAKKWNDPERDKWQQPGEIVAALALVPGAIVAEIGAGTGYMVAPLSNAVGQDGTVFAIDASSEMVEYLAKRKADLGPARIITRKVGPDDPEFSPASVD